MLGGLSKGHYILRNGVKIIVFSVFTSPEVSNSLGRSHIYLESTLTF